MRRRFVEARWDQAHPSALCSHPPATSLHPSASLSVSFFFPFTRARSLRRFARRSLLPLAATEAGVLPRRFEKLPVHVFSDRYEKLASDMVSSDVFRAFIEIIAGLLSNTLMNSLFSYLI